MQIQVGFLRGLLIVCGLALFACTAKPPETLRLGINAWPGYEYLHLADVKGYFREAGLDVKVVEFNSLSDARRAYERGQIDALGTTIIEVLQSRENSTKSLQIAAVTDYSDGADMIVAQSRIQTVADLKGKKVGLELASLGVYILARALEKNGLQLSDVELVSLDQLSLAEALEKGELDAIVTYPPTNIKLLANNQFHIVFTSKEIPKEVLDVLAVDAEFAKKYPEKVTLLLDGFEKAYQYSLSNPADAYAIMAKREGISAAEFEGALKDGIKIVSRAESTELLKAGGILSQVIDNSNQVLRRSGQIKGPDRRQGIVLPSHASQ